MKLKLLLLPLLLTVSLQAHLHFEYENHLIAIFEHPEFFDYENIMHMHLLTAQWIKKTLNEYAVGKIKLSRKDREYLERMSYLATQIANWRAENELVDIFE